ncbi:hypothetical protein ACN47E_006951 [Coniothyrium glycines]
MASLFGLVALSLSLFSPALASVASPQSIGSDLTVVTHNDLYGNLTTRRASSITINTHTTHSAAALKCAALGTTLWKPGSQNEDVGYLRYLGFEKSRSSRGAYWIRSNSTTRCQAITTHGTIETYPCNEQLPALCSNAATAEVKPVAVQTNDATIVGRRDKSSFRFLGIKYASIAARFAHSTYLPPTPGSNVSALEYGPKCFQGGCGAAGQAACSEDCLSLNIWTPYLPNGNSTVKKRPVMVWIYGGGFASGTASDPTFDGSALASRGDVVLVTINYRLSNFGFLALSNTSLTGNYGLRDQSTALDWLHAHVAAFGGDKDRITIFGQSAGAASVRALIASPEAQRKFAGAIMQSTPQGLGYASTFAEYITIAEATNRTSAVVTQVGCAQFKGEELVTCLQNVDPVKLIAGTISTYPVVDGSFLIDSHLLLGASSAKLNIPIMLGIMHDDGSPFTSYPSTTNVSALLTSQSFPASAILSAPSLFPIPANQNTTLALFNFTSHIATDTQFRCLGQSTAYTAAKNSRFKSVFAYEFDRAYQLADYSPNPPACEAPSQPGFPYGNPSAPYYKCHSGELYSVFGTTTMFRAPRDEDDIPFSQFVLDSWASFARTGDPNPTRKFLDARGFTNTTRILERSGRWERVQSEKPRLKVLDVVGRMEGFRDVEQCEVLGQGLAYYDD